VATPEGEGAPGPLHGCAIKDQGGGSFTEGVVFLFCEVFALGAVALADERSSLVACLAASTLGTTEPEPFLTTSEESFEHERKGGGRVYEIPEGDGCFQRTWPGAS
jgi:hypothetical protein